MSDLGNRAIMADNIQRLMEMKGKTRTEVCEDLGIKYTTFSDWVNGKTYPRIDKIELMANYFGVPKSELVERHGLKLKYLIKEWKSNKSARLYMCIDSRLLDDLEAFAKADNMSLEDEIEDILHWNIENRIEDIINEQDAREMQEWYNRHVSVIPQSTPAQPKKDTDPAQGSPEQLLDGSQVTSVTQEGKDTTPAADGQKTAPEGQ